MINSSVDEIKNRLDIVDIIKDYIKLEKAGANFRAPCPFHSEKTASFFVSPSRQIWHCFGSCGEGGDMFKFVMKYEGVEFVEALRILAGKAGVELKKQDPKIRTEKEQGYEICEIASEFFQKQLEHGNVGQEAKQYLLKRGIQEQSIKKWQIGYAPDKWQGLSDFLVGRGYNRQEIETAGLGISSSGGKYFDRFRGRIMFPLSDRSSRIVGFTGRIFQKEDPAKYVNTPTTLLYDKSKIFYGLDKAQQAIRKQNKCILVEGQTDVIMSHQAGVENVVATSGTALTLHQLSLLRGRSLIIGFDMDSAGNSAAKRGIDLAQTQGFNIRVIEMPEDLDPADVVAKNPDEWKKMIENTKPIVEFYFDTVFNSFDSKNPEHKKEILEILRPVINRISNKIERAYWVQRLANGIEIKEEIVEEELKNGDKIKYSTASVVGELKQEDRKDRKQKLEERIIALAFKISKNVSLLDQKYFSYFSDQTREILNNLKKDPDFLEKEAISKELKDFINHLCFEVEIEKEIDGKDKKNEDMSPEEEIQICFKEIELMEEKKDLNQIYLAIKKAEQENNFEEVDSLMQKANIRSSKINELQGGAIGNMNDEIKENNKANQKDESKDGDESKKEDEINQKNEDK